MKEKISDNQVLLSLQFSQGDRFWQKEKEGA